MELNDIRREYLKNGLDLADLKPDPIEQFQDWLDHALSCEMFSDPTAMNVATVSESGQPSLRTVLLKQYDNKGFVFYTNLKSRKAHEIANNNKVCLSFAWLPLERQIIIYGTAEKLSIAEATSYFLSRPHDSQLAAWASQQSKMIQSRKLLEQAFSQIKNKFKEGEVPLPDFWGGYRVRPYAIEFWQGRPSRLHDRFMYQQQDNNTWTIERLQP